LQAALQKVQYSRAKPLRALWEKDSIEALARAMERSNLELGAVVSMTNISGGVGDQLATYHPPSEPAYSQISRSLQGRWNTGYQRLTDVNDQSPAPGRAFRRLTARAPTETWRQNTSFLDDVAMEISRREERFAAVFEKLERDGYSGDTEFNLREAVEDFNPEKGYKMTMSSEVTIQPLPSPTTNSHTRYRKRTAARVAAIRPAGSNPPKDRRCPCCVVM